MKQQNSWNLKNGGSLGTHLFFNANSLYFTVSGISTVDELKTKLENSPLQIVYELAEPIVVELDYPTAETNMDYLVWDFGTEEAIASYGDDDQPITSAPFRADIKYADNFVDDIRKNKEDIATNKANIAKNASAINSKQNTLTLTTKPNGNIVIGNLAGQSKEFMPATPSGDPMHYAYEDIGAVYNATNTDITITGMYGDTIVHKAGRWLLTEVGDLTNEDMCVVLANRTNWNASDLSAISAYSPARTVVPKTNWANVLGWYGSALNIRMHGAFFSCSNMETIQFSTGPDADYKIQPTHFSIAFRACPKLTKILDVINCKNLSDLFNTFYGCNSLVGVRLLGLKSNVSLSHSPLLSKESLLYMIRECASGATFTITLHSDVYNLAKDFENGWGSEVEAAIDTAEGDKSTKITLASA